MDNFETSNNEQAKYKSFKVHGEDSHPSEEEIHQAYREQPSNITLITAQTVTLKNH